MNEDKLPNQKEYILLCEDKKSIQTKLNQWRHLYKLDILGIDHLNDSITILLTREKIDA